ncbi:MAG: ComEC family competence protein [Candidatus Yanofskybacteria bacterium]|nr:ComEC family competence protein [Candidatus Yanofskybacteria bacterium]
MHRSNFVLLALMGFLGGIALASYGALGEFWPFAFTLCGAVCMLARTPRWIAVGGVLLGAALGIWRTTSALAAPSPFWDLAGEKARVTVTGFAATDLEPTASGGRYIFRAFAIGDTGQAVPVNDRVMVIGPDWIRPRQGQVFSITGTLQRPTNSADDFDYIAYLAKEGVHARMYFPSYAILPSVATPFRFRLQLFVEERLAAVRAGVVSAIDRAVPQPMAAYLAGILVGARGLITGDLKDIFARTGTSHILAISGYNITIIAALAMRMFRPLGRRRAYIGTVTGVILFVVLVGAGASVVRAAIMGLLALSAQQLGRTQSAAIALTVSAAAMCLVNPMLLRWDVGFQLSFLAVVGIIYGEPLLKPFLARIVRWEALGSMIATTLAAQVAVLPLILHEFGTLAVYTLPVNVLVLPLVPVAMALGFATAIGGMIAPFLGQLIGQSAWLVAAYQLTVIRWFAGFPYAAVDVHLNGVATIAMYAGLVGMCIAVYRRRVAIPQTA